MWHLCVHIVEIGDVSQHDSISFACVCVTGILDDTWEFCLKGVADGGKQRRIVLLEGYWGVANVQKQQCIGSIR
jgi:hypothetical protein